MIKFTLRTPEIPSLKNSKQIYQNINTGLRFVGTKAHTKKQMSNLRALFTKEFANLGLKREDILTGKVLPLDDSLQWIGFPESLWYAVDKKEEQRVIIEISKDAYISCVRPQFFRLRITWGIYKSLHRDGDNMLSSLLDALLDAVAVYTIKTRTALRSHATTVAHSLQKTFDKCV